jgi:hypothetical protein
VRKVQSEETADKLCNQCTISVAMNNQTNMIEKVYDNCVVLYCPCDFLDQIECSPKQYIYHRTPITFIVSIEPG